MESRIPEYDKTGHIRERTGAILPKLAPSNIYPSADGMVLIAGNQDTVFARLCEAMGQPALAKDARYATHVARGERQAELDALIADWSRELPTRELPACLHAAGVPAGLTSRVPEMRADPPLVARTASGRAARRGRGGQ